MVAVQLSPLQPLNPVQPKSDSTSTPSSKAAWQTGRFCIDLSRVQIMGIVNITPDSFSGHGNSSNPRAALAHAKQLLQEGAAILDLGAESTRPGATALSAQEEQCRLEPVLTEVLRWNVPISIDTYHAETMQWALDLGADIINDIWALRSPGAIDVVATHPSCGVCLMHMHGEPKTMQISPMQGDVLPSVLVFLQARSQALLALGVQANRIALDPGIGFGKTAEQNFTLLRAQEALTALGYSLLIGWSRKSSLGLVTTLAANERMLPSVVSALLAAQNGARVLRVHDVAQTQIALQVWYAMQHPEQIKSTPQPPNRPNN